MWKSSAFSRNRMLRAGENPMIKYPKTIYLFPMDNLIVWDADNSSPEADGAQEYVRADIHESVLKRQGNAAKMGMNAATKSAYKAEENAKRLLAKSNPAAIESERAANAQLTGEVERLQARVAEKCDAPVGWIAPDKYRAACESKMEFFKTIKELREQNEKLKARVARLELEEIGAKKAFAAVADTKSAAESRVIELEKSIGSLMTELYQSGQPGRQVEKIEGGHNDAM